MKGFKYLLALALTFSFMLSFPSRAESPQPAAQTPVTLKTGDYVLFGHYYDAPVLWRVVRMDNNGNPMLITDRIIALKPFDARGSMRPNPAWTAPVIRDREGYGSNYWHDANIRQWLNSFADDVEWVKSPPSKDNTFMSNNPYDREKGFLADGNFTGYERSLIMLVTHKTLLSAADKDLKDGGEEPYAGEGEIGGDMPNYDNSYYQTVTDGVFLPDTKDIQGIYLNESIFGNDYWRAKPTGEAVDKSTYKNPELSADKYWSYWIRTPDTGDDTKTMLVKNDSETDFQAACGFDGTIGIRPALWLNCSSGAAFAGSGTAADPYELQRSREITKDNNRVLFVSSGAILIVFLMVFMQKGGRKRKKRRG